MSGKIMKCSKTENKNKKVVTKAPNIDQEVDLNQQKLTAPIISSVLHGERTTQFRSFGPVDELPPMNHLKKGSMIPAISNIDVNVFSSIRAATCRIEQFI